jgi:Actin
MALYTTENAVNAVVADIGGYATKIGYAGEDFPRSYFRSVRTGSILFMNTYGNIGLSVVVFIVVPSVSRSRMSLSCGKKVRRIPPRDDVVDRLKRCITTR